MPENDHPPIVDQSDPTSPHYRPPYDFGRDDGGDEGPNLITRVQDGWIWMQDAFGDWVPVGRAPDAVTGAGGSSSSWTGQYVNDALTAASQAIQAFLSGQSLADARKLASAEQFQKMAAFALPEGSLPPGYEEGGPAQHLAALQGRGSYTPPPVQTRQVNPSQLAEAGAVPAEIMSFIQQMLGAADKGKVITTGGSSSRSG